MKPTEPSVSDDPVTLQAMLAAERVENERLRKIIRELQRHRFGRRAESLPPTNCCSAWKKRNRPKPPTRQRPRTRRRPSVW